MDKIKIKLTQKDVQHIWNYDPNTGIFTWKNPSGKRVKPNQQASTVMKDGYVMLVYKNVHYLAHRIAFLYMVGYCPENQIDHRDRKRNNNKWKNLRELTPTCNIRNSGMCIDNTSGVKGVYWSKKMKKWTSAIGVKKSLKHLGCFDSFQEAVYHRLAAEQCLNWNFCIEDSSAFLWVRNNLK